MDLKTATNFDTFSVSSPGLLPLRLNAHWLLTALTSEWINTMIMEWAEMLDEAR